ncbi:MAG: phenylalanine--tRNA ligase subunit beta [Vampirovibrionales bacterium]|nr:phenylalanine--tRNA ligase subunit beta [Vampirovibrionales bacterium]
MRISMEWLSESLDLSGVSPEDLAESLTSAGLEVEAIERREPVFQGVRLGRILAVHPHPNADRLRLVDVDLGDSQPQVVCGAPNVRPGLWIAFAPQDACVLGRDGQPFTLGKAVIRGVESRGMICSLPELGLEQQYEQEEDGIWVLDALAIGRTLGEPLQTTLGLCADVILETAPTANRGDLMSMRGVSREVAALIDRPTHRSEPPALEPTPGYGGFRIELQDPAVCAYYGGVLMRGLTLGPSPTWLTRRLEAAGVRPINNVVDITNYVMLEWGQPLHAFDADKLGSGVIGVRRATPGETLTTLDGVSRALSGESVVITANNAPVALAGLMGGESTEIDEGSTRLFLEGAFFPPASNRRSAKSVGLRTEASARFERGVDLAACRSALFRAVALYQELAGATLEGFIESPPPAPSSTTIALRIARIDAVLGARVTLETVTSILEKLGFAVTHGESPETLVVRVPSYRQQDVSREIDLIEEVVRIVGYGQTPDALPQTVRAAAKTPRQRAVDAMRRALEANGLQEVVSNSLIGETLLEKTGVPTDRARLVSVTNSQSRDHTLLRQSLTPTLLEIARHNQAQGAETVWIYEIGRSYFRDHEPTRKDAGVREPMTVGALITGTRREGAWQGVATTSMPDFYAIKGVVESLLLALRIEDAQFEALTDSPLLHPGKAARVQDGSGRTLGVLGELHPQLAQRLKFRQTAYTFELDGDALLAACGAVSQTPQAPRLSSYPAVTRDMAFSAPDTLTHRCIVQSIYGLGDPLLRDVALFDEYRGEQAGAGRRSLAYRLTLQSSEETLCEERIDQSVSRIRDYLRDALAVTFR